MNSLDSNLFHHSYMGSQREMQRRVRLNVIGIAILCLVIGFLIGATTARFSPVPLDHRHRALDASASHQK